MPERSPLISEANTETPAREKPSARTCSVTVLPVPVAPVTRPCRLASARVRYSGFSLLPTKIVLPSSKTTAGAAAGFAAGFVVDLVVDFALWSFPSAARDFGTIVTCPATRSIAPASTGEGLRRHDGSGPIPLPPGPLARAGPARPFAIALLEFDLA